MHCMDAVNGCPGRIQSVKDRHRIHIGCVSDLHETSTESVQSVSAAFANDVLRICMRSAKALYRLRVQRSALQRAGACSLSTVAHRATAP